MSGLARPPYGGRVSWRGLLSFASLAICLVGLAMLFQGLTVPLAATVAQLRLEREFSAQLATAKGVSDAPAKAPPRARHIAVHRLTTGGPIARLHVERLAIDRIVLASNGTPEQLDLGPTMVRKGHADAPVTILSAHRDTHFRFIRDLQAGDEVTLQAVTGEVERYRIVRFETVRWDAFTYPLDPAQPLLALATCYPFDGTEFGGPWRRVAWAVRIG